MNGLSQQQSTPPQPNVSDTLIGLVPLAELQEFVDRFADVSGMYTAITDPMGRSWVSATIGSTCEFIRSCPAAVRTCELCIRNGGEKARTQLKPILQQCDNIGLSEGVIPITVAGRHLGNWIICSSVEDQLDEARVRALASSMGLDAKVLWHKVAHQLTMSSAQFHKYLALAHTIARSIANQAFSNLQIEKDISSQHSADEHGRLLTMAVENVAEAILVTEADGRILYSNPAFERLMGYSRIEIVGDNCQVLYSTKEQSIAQNIKDAVKDGGIWRGIVKSQRKNGQIFDRRLTVSGVRNGNGTVANLVTVSSDATLEVEQETHLREATKMQAIGTLAAGIAHDFNNILYAIQGYTELVMSELEPDSLEHNNLQEVLNASHRAAQIVQQLLQVSSQEESERTPIHLSPVLKGALKLLRQTLPATIELQQLIDASVPPVVASAPQIHQAMMQICSNAYLAMRERGGVLRVRLTHTQISVEEAILKGLPKEGHYALIEVSDTGTGMDESALARVFEPYFTTRPPGSGAGIGLTVVHSIVTAHGGSIRLESEPGLGTKVSVHLPIEIAEHEADPMSIAANEPKSTHARAEVESVSGTRVLLVDDEAVLVRLLSLALRRRGFVVDGYTNVMEALEVFLANPEAYDVVVTDQTMPLLTGIEFGHRIAAKRPDLPVILCSGFDQRSQNQEVPSCVRAYVQKPIEVRELTAVVERTIAQARQERPVQ